VQEITVMPGEAVKVLCGIYRPTAATGATGVRVRVVDTSTGKGWDGAVWADGGVLDSQAVVDTWKDISEGVAADAARTEKTIYQVIVEPIATTYDATSYVYLSDNGGASGYAAVVAEADVAMIIGHNLPADADVDVGALTLIPVQPSFYKVDTSPSFVQVWTLDIQMPAGNQPRPIIGEVWIGLVRTLLAGSPVVPIGLEEASKGQIRVEAARRRVEVVGEDARPVAAIDMSFATRDAASYVQIRDEIARLTRFGADPLVLLPSDAFEGGTIYHGRIADKVSYSRILGAYQDPARTFGMPFSESPFAST
jgi:hypothetical protein